MEQGRGNRLHLIRSEDKTDSAEHLRAPLSNSAKPACIIAACHAIASMSSRSDRARTMRPLAIAQLSNGPSSVVRPGKGASYH